jgi:hypothetical protein
MHQMDPQLCDLCGQAMRPHTHYVVRIDVFADPALPATTAQELDQTDFDSTIGKLLEQIKDMSAQELADQVHRRFEFKICPPCQARFLSNPLGKPRGVAPARN